MQSQNSFPPNQTLSDVVASMQRREQQQLRSDNLISTRKRLNAYDIESQRYECFCSKQYLSHTALYCHVKGKHPDYFVYNRGLSNGNLVQTYDPNHGYKIRKLMFEKVTFHSDSSRRVEKPLPVAMHPLKTPTQSATENLKAGYLLGKQEVWRIYQINQIKKLQDRIFQSKQCRDLQDKWLKIYTQKLLKMQSIIGNMSQITDYYERILRILNIKPVVHTLDNPIYKVESDDDQSSYE